MAEKSRRKKDYEDKCSRFISTYHPSDSAQFQALRAANAEINSPESMLCLQLRGR